MEYKDKHDDCVPFWVMALWGLMNWLLSGYVYAKLHGINFWS